MDGDISCFDQAKKDLQSVQEKYLKDWGIEPSPIKPIYTPNGKEYESGGVLYNYVPILLYGYTKWSNLFNERQEIAFITISDYIKKARKKMRELSINDEYANALTTYLALALSRHTSYNSKCCFWEPTGERSFNAFGRQALPMVFDYAEQNPFGVSTGNWNKQINNTVIILNKIDLNDQAGSINVSQGSAMSINHPDQFFDAIFTDPPYYDNVPYSNLSDWFFLRLKSILFDVHPDLFSTPLTPKNDEIIDDLSLFRGMPNAVAKLDDSIRVKDNDDFQDMLSKAFIEFNRILKNDGIITIVYTHKSQEAWDAIINAIIESRLYVTASWPIQTEMLTRLRANRSAAISSSIYMVCRKRNTDEIAYFNEIKHAIKTRIHKKLDQFWAEGIGGSDFFISAIGPAVEVFGKYASVEKLSGEKVSVKELLEYVRQIVSEYALSRILKSPQLGGVDQLTRFYLVWRWTFGNNLVLFDDGNKMALSIGVGLDEHWNKGGIIEKSKAKVKVKSHVERRKDRTFETRIKREYPQIEEAGGVPSGKQTLMLVDILQECLILWDRSDRTSIARLLEASGHRKNDLFWQVAQSISDVLPDGDKEKQTIQGFLLGKRSYMKGEVPLDTHDSKQETIFGEE